MADNLPRSLAPTALPQGQARLILQDPLAFDQATQPNLRASTELIQQQEPGMEREKARELWENLSLEPEVAQERQAERKRLLARAEALAQEAAMAKAQALELQTRLAAEREQRLNHPLVYAGAVGLLGLGALWWIERRKRIQLQERELDLLAQQSPSLLDEELSADVQASNMPYSLEDSPDLASDFATDLAGLPGSPSYAEKTSERLDVPSSIPPQDASPDTSSTLTLTSTSPSDFNPQPPALPEWAQAPVKPVAHELPTEEEIAAQSAQMQDRSLLGISKRVLSNIIQRKSRTDVLNSSQYNTQGTAASSSGTLVLSTQAMRYGADLDSTQMSFDTASQAADEHEQMAPNLESMQSDAYDPDQANIELLSQTRVTPQRGEDALEHLLELRTAVTGLTVLGRPEGAARLLEEHISADPGTCAWAYLEYMHLCEKMELRDEFEAMRKQYRQQFNRMAPYWHEPNSNVLGLDGYARAAHELCLAWALGAEQAQQTISSWLVGPLLGRKLVQLPAYQDLFDLYEMLEFIETMPASTLQTPSVAAIPVLTNPVAQKDGARDQAALTAHHKVEDENDDIDEQDFVPTVSLLDLDYEFSSDVTLEESEVRQSEKAVTIVKTGNFTVDFNVSGTQMGFLESIPAELGKK